jgi:hypothetical protein
MDALLDLTQRNPLVSFRRDGRRVLPLDVESIAALEDGLASGAEYRLVGEHAESRPERKRSPTLAATLTQEALYGRAVELDRDARKAADEGGSWNLYVALGVLAWKETANSPKLIESPILLVPVSLAINRTTREATLSRHDDETIANPALIELMRQEFAVSLDSLRELPEDEAGVDVPLVMATVREAVARQPDWTVMEDAFVARFTFDKLLMWKDLREHGDKLLTQGIAGRIADPSAARRHRRTRPRR